VVTPYVENSRASSFHTAVEEITAYYDLFGSSNDAVLSFLFHVLARFTRQDGTLNKYYETVSTLLRNDVLDQLKYFSNHTNNCIRRLAREGLTNLGERIYTLEAFLKESGISDYGDVMNILIKAEIDLPLLLNERLSLNDININLGRISMLSEGKIMKILSQIMLKREEIIKTKENKHFLAKQKSKQDNSMHNREEVEEASQEHNITDKKSQTIDIDVFISYCWKNKAIVKKIKKGN